MKATTKNAFIVKISVWILCIGILFFSPRICSQNFSGLENTQLNKLDDISSAGISLFAERIKGKIENVTVIHDSERVLKISVGFSEFEQYNYTLIAEIKNAQKLKQKEFKQVRVNLNGASSPVELEFNLDENTPEGTEINSAFLELRVGSKNLKPVFLYSLNKNWKTEINAENLVIPIVLEPIGSASDLKENTQEIVIPKRKPQLKYTIDKNKLARISNHKVADYRSNNTTKNTQTASTIDGVYTNNDANTRSTTKIVISNKGKKIQVFGKCSPNDCDWGVKSLTPLRGKVNTYRGIFESNIAKSTFKLTFSKNNIDVVHTRDYKAVSRPTKVYKNTFTKLQQALQPIVMYNPNVNVTNTPPPSDTTEEVDTEPEGPDNKPISLWEDLVADHDFEFPYEITNIRMDIYPDKNLASGTFYYLPTAFHLRWNADQGYQFKMLYGTAESSESSGNVRMNGTLTPGISSKEIALMKSLLQSYVGDNPNYNFTELKIMPINQVPAISLSSGLEGQYNISSDKIDVTISSSLINPIDVSWSTDNQTKDDMQNALSEGVGIKGIMTLNPDSETVPAQNIPVRITLADTRTLGKFTLEPNRWRSENWTNKTPFPLSLKKVHALIIEKQGNKTIPLIYSWDLNNTVVPSMANVTFDATKMPQWIETKNKTEQIWLDYSIVECTSCVNEVVDQLTGGTSVSKIKNISFMSFQLFNDETDVAMLKVKIRSKFADPKGEKIIELDPIYISEDNTNVIAGPMYLPETESLAFEYYFTLVKNDGVTYNSNNWLTGSETDVFIGIQKIKEAIPDFNPHSTED